MRRVILPVCLLATLFVLCGCASGPNYLFRTVDDWQNTNYVDNPLLTGVLTDVVPVYGLIKFGAGVADWIVLNPVQFWGYDVWSSEGASFQHENPKSEKESWAK